MTPEQLEHALTKAFRMGAASIAVPDCAAETKAEFAGFVLDQCAGRSTEPVPPTYATEINRLRNVIQAACTAGTDHMIERWKVLFPDAPVPSVQPTVESRDAARYRWLRDVSVPPHNFYLSVPTEFDGVRYAPGDVDAYIDQARAA